ncbi:hypothetical protein, partial [Vibrio sp. 03_296]|uniref:hypothetical protein n=1 Tax=Vibrio sp. 03_296 TaxID=2024409 RepID=UPI002D7F1981
DGSAARQFPVLLARTSISLVSPTLHCVVVKHGEDLTDVVSHLCEHQGSNQQVNWIDGEAIAESQIEQTRLHSDAYLKITSLNSIASAT